MEGTTIAFVVFFFAMLFVIMGTKKKADADDNTGTGLFVLLGLVILFVWMAIGAPGVN